jgi:hypothetical protein
MTSDDQHFLDYLSGVSSSISNFVAGFANDADKSVSDAVDAVRHGLREALVYVGLKAPKRPPPVVQQSFLERTHSWASRNKAITAAVIAFVGTGAIGALLLYYSQAGSAHPKRRARKARNGARKEVVGTFQQMRYISSKMSDAEQ